MRVFISGTRLGAFALVVALLAGCASTNDNEDSDVPQLAENELYQQARSSLDSGNYSGAVDQLEALDTRYPFGEYAEQVQLELIYAYYQVDNWEAARAAASRFIRLNPDHPQVDYAYYMRGLAAYQAGRFSLERLRLIDISKRDLGASRDAYADFRELVQRFPDSQYAPDARQRIVYLRNLLAEHELHVADFYLRKGAYLAAVERGRWVIEHYPQSSATRDALAVMVEGYLGLDMRDRAREVLTTLIENDPDNARLNGRTFQPRHVDAKPLSV
ncbi:competence protein ComL [Litchfieldella anticariensis FP35 = DSM 16096]|uniref:Outer membrane protein assembly factor BamD n=1 Tax=Litchfieldella anticariensis (strain DSM 16096 / CECT 5854 / CIP 108499 / LMG 22089 / FP35) TaxID=1121939 RepID=S2KCW6_LITA3|nr:outer membrane protein assembly factor BamD [Halomonas anticariensis]EPC00007.1 competence protein ComL [Halomonas anticariensis FP35 = DSM 16096]